MRLVFGLRVVMTVPDEDEDEDVDDEVACEIMGMMLDSVLSVCAFSCVWMATSSTSVPVDVTAVLAWSVEASALAANVTLSASILCLMPLDGV